MPQYTLLIDHKFCFDCKACEVACKQENELPVGPRWMRVITVGPKRVGDKILVDFVPTTCKHCGKPACVDACPAGAIVKRADGIVTIDESLCNGCLACIPACPFAAPQFNPEKNVVGKCNLCLNRISQGLKPSCVQACPASAIKFGEINEVINQLRDERAQLLAE